MMTRQRCANDNHGRQVVTVRFCAGCGVIVNERIRAAACRPEAHDQMRRTSGTFCVDCGEALRRAR